DSDSGSDRARASSVSDSDSSQACGTPALGGESGNDPTGGGCQDFPAAGNRHDSPGKGGSEDSPAGGGWATWLRLSHVAGRDSLPTLRCPAGACGTPALGGDSCNDPAGGGCQDFPAGGAARISQARAAPRIPPRGGPFTVWFVKRSDGSIRRMVCRSAEGVPPPPRRARDAALRLVTVTELDSGEPRCIPLEGILCLTCNNQSFRVTDAPRAAA
ncbi:MAG TPA: hypothetical protein PKH24_16010, partial [Sedimentisphaerales bacterium]|nr:hypothetical protein [Sedimentisphaerales bacterium]